MREYFRLTGSMGRVIRYCIALTLIFIALVFLLPVNKMVVGSYNLTVPEYHIATILIYFPSIVVWCIAFFGYAKLHQYSIALKNVPEAKFFEVLSIGLGWLAWSLPVSLIMEKLLLGIANNHQSFTATATILSNYVSLFTPFIAFVIIGIAARGLVGVNGVNFNSSMNRLMIFIFGFVGILYCYFILKSFELSSLSSTHNPYYLPAWVMVVTVIIPYLYAWFIGLLAAYEIALYTKKLSGILYKRALHFVVYGLVAIVVSFVASQYLISVWHIPYHLAYSNKLLVIVLFRIVGGIGFIVLSFGAAKLTKIEQV